ncbi:MAG: hypothetical protein PHC88_11530 [Terrimicrobiaceae bacterium]|nr:hypothetical protein [Terrimicrobiaceae bacterium]
MSKFLAIALTITALAIGNTFAGDCGGCCGGGKDKTATPAPTATPAKP